MLFSVLRTVIAVWSIPRKRAVVGRCQTGLPLPSGNHNSSRLCPSGSRNLMALIPAAASFDLGMVCGRGEICRTWCLRTCAQAASISRTTTAKCWNQRSLLYEGTGIDRMSGGERN